MQIYLIGGSVRDSLMGRESKDKDFVVVSSKNTIDEAWDEMISFLTLEGYVIFEERKNCFTVRARFPLNHKYKQLTADFVLARKEIGYIPGTRTPIVEPGNMVDDVFRRDFTVNTLYLNDLDEIIDLTGRGVEDIKYKLLDTPTDPFKTFKDDPLRVFRAIRFSVTKEFAMSERVEEAIFTGDFDFSVISIERVRTELFSCFKENTVETLRQLYKFPKLQNYAFKDTNLWLKPTITP